MFLSTSILVSVYPVPQCRKHMSSRTSRGFNSWRRELTQFWLEYTLERMKTKGEYVYICVSLWVSVGIASLVSQASPQAQSLEGNKYPFYKTAGCPPFSPYLHVGNFFYYTQSKQPCGVGSPWNGKIASFFIPPPFVTDVLVKDDRRNGTIVRALCPAEMMLRLIAELFNFPL